jgi:Flp pilus assembly protein TadG
MTMRRERGNAVVEFALSSLLIMTVLVMSVRFGYSLYTYNKLEALVSAGARYASRLTYDSTTETPSQSFQTAVSNMVIYGNPAGGTRPLVPGVSAANVAVAAVMENRVPKRLKVSIVNYGLTSWTLNGKPYAEFRYMGRYAP